MEVYEAIRTILAVRQYQDKPVPDDALGHILEAGRLTASASNRQRWHFVVVRERETLRQLGTVTPYGAYTADAALAIVVAVEPGAFGVSDGSLAVHSMMLAAWGEGIGANWVGFVGHLAAVNGLLGIPETLDVLAIVPFGYPASPVGQGKKKRKSLAEIVSSERFGQPLA
jgi:nitroreductase